MKTRNIYSALCTTFVAGLVLVACNDYDAAQTAYEEIVDSDVTITPPNMDSAWELQLIPNVGQHSGEVFVYKDKKYDKLFTRTLGWMVELVCNLHYCLMEMFFGLLMIAIMEL